MRILSLGAGVQSSTIALMIVHGEIEPVSAGIFADTQNEASYTYRWLNYLESILTFPIHRVSVGNLGRDFLSESGRGFHASPPFFTKDADGEKGMLHRNCTSEYKLNLIRREARAFMESVGEKHIDTLIGISTDEAHRMRHSNVQYITNVYPLIDRRMNRDDCVEWMKSHGYPIPEKSACTFCPYRSDAAWKRMKEKYPDDFSKAVEYDRQLRTWNKHSVITSELYVHRSLVPLSEASFDRADKGIQLELFGNDCEGLCGV